MKKFDLTLAALVLLLMSIFTTACKQDRQLRTSDYGIIYLSLNAESLRAVTDDAKITNSYVFVFIDNNILEKKVYTAAHNATAITTLTVTKGQKDIYVVANIDEKTKTKLENVTSPTHINDIILDAKGQPIVDIIPMYGETKGVNVVDDHTEAPVKLTRIAAKVVLTFSNESGKELRIDEVTLLKNNSKVKLNPAINYISNNYFDYSYNGMPITLSADNANNKQTLETQYFFENLAGISHKENATKLHVKAHLDGIATEYEVYVNEAIAQIVSPIAGHPTESTLSKADHQYQLRRNHQYHIIGHIKGFGKTDGLQVTTKVLPWSLVSSTIKYRDDYHFKVYPSIDSTDQEAVEVTSENHSFEITDERPYIDFYFDILNPQGSYWRANLTLGPSDDFEFVDGVNAHGHTTGWQDGTGIHVIRVKVKDGVSKDKECSTELWIVTGMGTIQAPPAAVREIPIINGYGVVGPGKRIKITRAKA